MVKYRDVSLLDVVTKIFMSGLLGKLSEWERAKEILTESLAGICAVLFDE